MRFGQDLLTLAPDDPQALSLLAEIDYWLGDLPGAADKWRRLVLQVDDAGLQTRLTARIAACEGSEPPSHPLVDELETLAEAMRLHATGDPQQATALLEHIEEQGQLPTLFPSPDFYCLLGQCRLGAGDQSGAVVALQKALSLEPDHPVALDTLDSM
jgi:tetratricopeptide (TPR) repeat protein